MSKELEAAADQYMDLMYHHGEASLSRAGFMAGAKWAMEQTGGSPKKKVNVPTRDGLDKARRRLRALKETL